MTQASLLRALVAPRRRRPAARRRRTGHGLPMVMPLAMGTGGRLLLLPSHPNHRARPTRSKFRIQTLRHPAHRGMGFFGDVWDGIKSVASKFGPRLIDAGLKRFGVGMRRRPAVRRRRSGGSMMPVGSGTMRRSRVVRRRRHVGGLLYPGSHYGGSSMIPLRMP